MKVLYIDTNIFLNLLLKEELFIEKSRKLINMINDKKFKGITSILTLMEIYRVLQKQKVKNETIDEAVKKIVEMEVEIIIPESYVFIQAYDLVKKYRIDIDDALHLAIAISNDAILVTWDEKFLKKSKRIIETKTPEDIILL